MDQYRKILLIGIIGMLNSFCSPDVDAQTLIIDSPIAEGQFKDRTDIEEVIFIDNSGVFEIPDYAFLGCTSLKKATLPKELEKIGFQAFSECSSLKSINFPDALTDIGSNAFAYCSHLENFNFPESLRHVGHNAFSFCSSLESVVFHQGVEEIESYAFSDCDSLKLVVLPDNDHMLGELIFNCCSSLEGIISPSPKAPTFDCNSFIFDPEDKEAYQRCGLIVPKGALKSYLSSPSWSLFQNIEEW